MEMVAKEGDHVDVPDVDSVCEVRFLTVCLDSRFEFVDLSREDLFCSYLPSCEDSEVVVFFDYGAKGPDRRRWRSVGS